MTDGSKPTPPIAIYVAVARNGVIGRDGGMPWHLSSDLRRFKATTMGKAIVMGRKTWESLPKKPLPGRLNVVVTRHAGYAAVGALVCNSLEDALDAAHRRGEGDEICVIGGGEIYRAALPLADILHVTEVEAEVEGDTVFGPIEADEWELVAAQTVPREERDSHAMRFCTYRRKPAAD